MSEPIRVDQPWDTSRTGTGGATVDTRSRALASALFCEKGSDPKDGGEALLGRYLETLFPRSAALQTEHRSLLARAAALPLAAHSGLHTRAPADMVLHCAVHLFYDCEFDKGLLNLVAIHRLLLKFGALAGFGARCRAAPPNSRWSGRCCTHCAGRRRLPISR